MLFKESHATEDLLGHDTALDTLNQVIEAMPSPACIAVYGSWGSGKTSLMRRAERYWGDKGTKLSRTIWFDPWEHEQRGDVISPLVHTIVRSVHDRRKGEEVGKKLTEIGVRLAKTLLSLTVRLGAGYLAKKFEAEGLKGLKAEDLTKYFTEWGDYHDSIAGVKRDFQQVITLAVDGLGANGRLVIFLDDLDRCLPESVVSLLEATKLLLCGRFDEEKPMPVTFVFGLDRTIVGEAIAKRYPGSSTYTGESYLEKIFDFSVEMPTIGQEALGRFIQACTGQVHVQKKLMSVFTAGELAETLKQSAFSNPRVIKRVLNRLMLLLATEERANATKALLPGSAERKRFLRWLAGGERFRGFRYAFLEASKEEIEAFHIVCRGEAGQERIGSALRRAVGSPGFLGFYLTLFPADWGADQVEKERVSRRSPPTVAAFDEHLRSYGL